MGRTFSSLRPRLISLATVTTLTAYALVGLLASSAGAAVPHLARNVKTSTCAATGIPQYLVIDSRGSGEPYPPSPDSAKLDSELHAWPGGVTNTGLHDASPPAQKFAAELQRLHPADTVAVLGNPYPAVSVGGWPAEDANGVGAIFHVGRLGAYTASVRHGTDGLITTVAHEVSSCPSTKIILTGYSQGAQVTADFWQRHATAAERAHVAGVVLFGDPYFNPADSATDYGTAAAAHIGFRGLLGTRPVFVRHRGTEVMSWCELWDPICDAVPNRAAWLGQETLDHKVHSTAYPPDGTKAAMFFGPKPAPQEAAAQIYKTLHAIWDTSGLVTENGKSWLAVSIQPTGGSSDIGVHVFQWLDGGWVQEGGVAMVGGEMDGHEPTFPTLPATPIATADLTGSAEPNFLIRSYGADTPYFDVVADLGGRWRTATFDFGYKPTDTITAVGAQGRLVESIEDACGCATGPETYIWYTWNGAMFVPANPPGPIPSCSPAKLPTDTGGGVRVKFTKIACVDGWALAVGKSTSFSSAGMAVALLNEEHNKWVDVTLDDGAFIGNDPEQYDIPIDLLKRLADRVELHVGPPMPGV